MAGGIAAGGGDESCGTGVSSYECKLDAGAFAACSSPKNYTSLADGSHTVSVVARDAVGNWQTSPTTATWTVDTTAPTPTRRSRRR